MAFAIAANAMRNAPPPRSPRDSRRTDDALRRLRQKRRVVPLPRMEKPKLVILSVVRRMPTGAKDRMQFASTLVEAIRMNYHPEAKQRERSEQARPKDLLLARARILRQSRRSRFNPRDTTPGSRCSLALTWVRARAFFLSSTTYSDRRRSACTQDTNYGRQRSCLLSPARIEK